MGKAICHILLFLFAFQGASALGIYCDEAFQERSHSSSLTLAKDLAPAHRQSTGLLRFDHDTPLEAMIRYEILRSQFFQTIRSEVAESGVLPFRMETSEELGLLRPHQREQLAETIYSFMEKAFNNEVPGVRFLSNRDKAYSVFKSLDKSYVIDKIGEDILIGLKLKEGSLVRSRAHEAHRILDTQFLWFGGTLISAVFPSMVVFATVVTGTPSWFLVTAVPTALLLAKSVSNVVKVRRAGGRWRVAMDRLVNEFETISAEVETTGGEFSYFEQGRTIKALNELKVRIESVDAESVQLDSISQYGREIIKLHIDLIKTYNEDYGYWISIYLKNRGLMRRRLSYLKGHPEAISQANSDLIYLHNIFVEASEASGRAIEINNKIIVKLAERMQQMQSIDLSSIDKTTKADLARRAGNLSDALSVQESFTALPARMHKLVSDTVEQLEKLETAEVALMVKNMGGKIDLASRREALVKIEENLSELDEILPINE